MGNEVSNINIKVESHIKDIKNELKNRLPIIFDAIGKEAEGNAISEITQMDAIDTGRLKNSITYAVSGESLDKLSYSDDQGNAYDNPTGTAPEENGNNIKVYIGTNVEYAPYIELGTSKMAARPFLKNAINNYTSDYKKILEEGLK